MSRDVLAVRREEAFSPGRVDDDAAILDAVCDRLKASGYRVSRRRAEDLADPPKSAIVLSMARSVRALEILSASPAWVVNDPGGVRSCTPGRLAAALVRAAVPLPKTAAVLACDLPGRAADWRPPFWVKRADAPAVEPDDAVRIDDPAQLKSLEVCWSLRGLRQAVLQEHADGVVERFRAVPATGFLDGPADLRPLVEAAGRATGLDIFGGEAVRTPSGPVVIDLWDWPSFARCRGAAADAIARFVREGDRGAEAA